MASTTASVLEIDHELQRELERLSERSGRPVHELAQEALRSYVHYEKAVAESLERGIADVEAGRTRTTQEVLEMLSTRRKARRAQ